MTSTTVDTRFEDYLSDKFQLPGDFNDIDTLLESVSLQKQQLDKQLQDARLKLAESRRVARETAAHILKGAAEFQSQQTSVNQRLMLVTSAESVDEAVAQLNEPLGKLKKVDLTKKYIELLIEINELVSNARAHLPHDPKEALKPYDQLKQLSLNLRQKQEVAEGAGIHLVNHVDNTATRLWAEMRKIMIDEFDAELSRLKWPAVKEVPSREWRDCFEKLLELQHPEIRAAIEPLVLLPMAVLVKPFVQNFRYQFMSDKSTSNSNHLGDYFLEWFLNETVKLEDYLREDVAPSLAAYFRTTELPASSVYVDPVAAFITSFLPVLREKISSVIAGIAHKDARLLSRFIAQLLKFDDSVRYQFKYDAGNQDHGWRGLASEVLETSFEQWLAVEKTFALERYHEIITAPNASHLDYDAAGQGRTKWSFGAYQVTDLLVSVTESYRKVRGFSQKMRFLIEIQSEILDRYQGRLIEQLRTYEATTSAVARTIHGISREEQARLEGVGGLDHLCRIYGSASHIIDVLKDWGNMDFFVDLFEDLQSKAQRTSDTSNLIGPISYSEVKESTSKEIDTNSEIGSVFDESITSYRSRLLDASVQAITNRFKYSFPIIFRSYITRAQWTTVGDSDDTVTLSPELDHPLKTLREELGFLAHALGLVPFRRIWRVAYDALEDVLWTDVLMKQSFTALGAARFQQDIIAIQKVVDGSCHTYRRSGADMEMDKLKEGVALLNLPVTDEAGGPALNDGSEVVDRMMLIRIDKFEARMIIGARVEMSE